MKIPASEAQLVSCRSTPTARRASANLPHHAPTANTRVRIRRCLRSVCEMQFSDIARPLGFLLTVRPGLRRAQVPAPAMDA
jgi:hypothetical protein